MKVFERQETEADRTRKKAVSKVFTDKQKLDILWKEYLGELKESDVS